MPALTLHIYLKQLFLMGNFRDFLRFDKQANPFHGDFDASAVKDEWRSWVTNPSVHQEKDLSDLKETALALTIFNKVYQSLTQGMRATINSIGMGKHELVEILIALHNSTHISVMQKIQNDFQKGGFHLSDIFAHQTASQGSETNKINTASAIASLVDTLQIAINQVVGISDLPERLNSGNFKATRELTQFLDLVDFYFALKTCYEAAIWNNGYIQQINERKFRIFFPDQSRLKLEEIGRFRLQQDSFTSSIRAQEKFFASGPDRELLDQLNKLRPVHLARVSISQQGYIDYTLKDSSSNTDIQMLLKDAGTINTFYPFLGTVALPKAGSLTIKDLLLIFRVLSDLFTHASKAANTKESYLSINELFTTPFRITHTVLVSYLCSRTVYSKEEIEHFLKLIRKPEKEWVSFWNWALLPMNHDYLVPMLTVADPNVFHQVDRWLETGGFDLERRGQMLEKYVAKVLGENLRKQGFWFQIPETNRFQTKDRLHKEEIDLMINLKEILVIAEVKCIKYPMEIRDYHNSFERLSKGARQVTRKAAFIEAHGHDFENIIGSIKGKPIVRLLVTNYPIFAGCQIEDIPVIDFHWLQGFIKNREYVHYCAQNTEYGLTQASPILAETLYHDEKQFNKIFKDQMNEPAFLSKFKPMVVIQDVQMSLAGFDFELYLEAASFIDKMH